MAQPKIDAVEIRRRLGYHPATEVTGPIHDNLREAYIALADYVVAHTPGSREQSLAMTALQESLQWANAAVACNQEAS